MIPGNLLFKIDYVGGINMIYFVIALTIAWFLLGLFCIISVVLETKNSKSLEKSKIESIDVSFLPGYKTYTIGIV